jgi:hypothetical protein
LVTVTACAPLVEPTLIGANARELVCDANGAPITNELYEPEPDAIAAPPWPTPGTWTGTLLFAVDPFPSSPWGL